MSNSATYLLSATHDAMVCIYLEHENQPEGAAYYFWLMHKRKNLHSGFAGRFLRANDYAQLTTEPNHHPDTTYRYSLDGSGQLHACCRTNDNEQWETFYHGTWYQFVNRRLKLKPLNRLYPFKRDESTPLADIMTLIEVQNAIDEKWSYAKQMRNQCATETAKIFEKEAVYLQQQRDAILAKYHLSLDMIKAWDFIIRL